MYRLFRVIAVVALMAAPVSAQPAGDLTAGKPMQVHGPPVAPAPGEQVGFAGVLKKTKLTAFPEKTIGEAVDGYRYFSKREWRETPAAGGKVYVDFTGWQKKGVFNFSWVKDTVASRGISIKFLVNQDGSNAAVMASRVEVKTDGMIHSQPLADLNGILKKIYENKEITF